PKRRSNGCCASEEFPRPCEATAEAWTSSSATAARRCSRRQPPTRRDGPTPSRRCCIRRSIGVHDMASEFPGRPLLLKGALIVFETPVPVPSNIIIFQYNPESMTRRFTQPGADLSGESQDVWLNAGDTKNVLQTPIE